MADIIKSTLDIRIENPAISRSAKPIVALPERIMTSSSKVNDSLTRAVALQNRA